MIAAIPKLARTLDDVRREWESLEARANLGLDPPAFSTDIKISGMLLNHGTLWVNMPPRLFLWSNSFLLDSLRNAIVEQYAAEAHAHAYTAVFGGPAC